LNNVLGGLLPRIHLAYWQLTVVRVVVLLVVLGVGGVVLAQLLHRTLSPRAGRARGPERPGPSGSLQPVADLVKAAQKEDLTDPDELGRLLRAAPIAALASAVVVAALVPAGPRAEVFDTAVGTLLVVTALLVSGLAASLAQAVESDGDVRAAARRTSEQVLAAVPVLLVAVVAVAAQSGSFSLQAIVQAQATGSTAGIGTFGEPFVVPQILAAVAFLVAQQGLRSRAPFDGPRRGAAWRPGQPALSGLRAMLLPAAGVAAEIAVAGVFATLFLGGWALPGVGTDDPVMDVAGPLVLAVKVIVLLIIGRWVELSLPRITTSRFVALAHRVLLPLAVVSLVCTVLLRRAV
jgi:NADH-quinone oxidoreductase subunit H